jgi:hypothetical protein
MELNLGPHISRSVLYHLSHTPVISASSVFFRWGFVLSPRLALDSCFSTPASQGAALRDVCHHAWFNFWYSVSVTFAWAGLEPWSYLCLLSSCTFLLYIYIYIYIHKYIHTYTHTHTYIYIFFLVYLRLFSNLLPLCTALQETSLCIFPCSPVHLGHVPRTGMNDILLYLNRASQTSPVREQIF